MDRRDLRPPDAGAELAHCTPPEGGGHEMMA
jgi:hypothetical protein